MCTFDEAESRLVGPGGQLRVPAVDEITRKLAMLIEGQCGALGPRKAAEKYGYSPQRYFQLRRAFASGGAAALANADAHPRRLVGLELLGRGIARADYEILLEGRVIGRVTSGAPSPTLGKSIALGYVPSAQSGVGQRVMIRIRKKEVEAQVVELPFLP